MKKLITLLLALTVIFSFSLQAQEENKNEEGYVFKKVKTLSVTPVRNQYRSGTCWSFSGLALMEAEMLRMGKPETDLSEMFVVRNTYAEKAKKYVRMHGNLNFGGGGAFNDVIMVMEKFGMVPEEVYNGLKIGEDKHIHGEMDAVLKGYIDEVIKNKNRKLSPAWIKGFNGILDAYLGEYPEKFTYKGTEYTPKSFMKDYVGLNTGDYMMFTSFSHHPFYDDFVLEVPDNWNWGEVENIPLNELIETIDNAIQKGYTVAWAADVSEKGFSWTNGLAIVPDKNIEEMDDTERAKWEKLSAREKQAMLYKFDKPGKEKEITQEIRQEGFDNFTTTDDHGMLICGLASDQNGTKYYMVKNSWGNDNHKYDGFFYVSEAFVKYKTMSIMLHKDAVPKKIMKKMDDD